MYLNIHHYLHEILQSVVIFRQFNLLQRPWPLLQFRNLFTQMVGLLRRGMSPSQGRYPHTGQHNTKYTHTHTSMPRVGFESTIPASERAKTVHASDRAATVTG
jgi:hypothetical protein